MLVSRMDGLKTLVLLIRNNQASTSDLQASQSKKITPLEDAAKRLRDEVLPNGRQRSFGQVADALNDLGFKKRSGKPHDSNSAKAAYYRAAGR